MDQRGGGLAALLHNTDADTGICMLHGAFISDEMANRDCLSTISEYLPYPAGVWAGRTAE